MNERSWTVYAFVVDTQFAEDRFLASQKSIRFFNPELKPVVVKSGMDRNEAFELECSLVKVFMLLEQKVAQPN